MTCYCSHIVVIAAVLHCAAPVHIFTQPPIRERSIVMPVSVCLPANTSPKTACPIFVNFLCMLPMSVARSSSGGVAIFYALPDLRMTSC